MKTLITLILFSFLIGQDRLVLKNNRVKTKAYKIA